MLKNDNWEKFCQAYVCGATAGNGRASYRAAGYQATPESASVKAHGLLKKPEVRGRIAELQSELAKDDGGRTARVVARLGLTKEAVIEEMAKLAFANILDYVRFNDAGEPIPDLAWVERDKAAAIVEMTFHTVIENRGPQGERVKRVRIRLDKRAALVDLGRHFGMFVDRKHAANENEYSHLTDEELEARIAELDRKIAEEKGEKAAAGFGDAPPEQKPN
jgi:phage terminase small subunit